MEIWDLYDQNRKKLNQTMVRGDVIPEGCFHLVVESIIINRSKQVLIQKRHPEKKGYPGYWEFSCGGSATTGDSSLEAMKREIKEEIGIDLNEANVQDVLFNTFNQSHYDFYFITQDIDQADIIMQPEEVVDCKWVTFEEVMQLLKEEKFVPYHNYGRSHFTYLEGKINEDYN
jgi:isopentenyldiphosphate isomerase